MTTSQPNPVELAKQGNVKAIAFLISRSLQSKNITAKTILKDSCLQVMLEADELPDQRTLADFIAKGVVGLKVPTIVALKVYGRRLGEETPGWSQEFNISEEPTSIRFSQDLTPTPSNTLPGSTKHQAASEQILVKCKGDNGTLELTETEIVIKRPGGFLSVHKKGENRIAYDDVVDFQYQRPGLLSVGYIYFQMPGSPRELTYLEATSNVNAIITQHDAVRDFDKAKEILMQKVNPQKYQNVFEGYNGTLILTETGITIKRNGGLMSVHPRGEKNISYKSITAIQLKPAGSLSAGFIQFTLMGGMEARGSTYEAVSDENTITFIGSDKTEEFEGVKSLIEKRIQAANTNVSSSSGSDGLDQLEKLASLKEKGILTEEEFQAKKRKILGL